MNALSLIPTRSPVAICLAVLFLLLLNSCGGYGSGGSAAGVPTLTSIAIYPTSEQMTSGTTATLKATGTYSNAAVADVTTTATWTSSASGVANVGPNTGLVTAASAVGVTTITASIDNGPLNGGVISGSGSITVTSAPLNSITVAPATISIAKGTTTTFTASGNFADSTAGNISGVVSWSCSDPTVASIDAVGNATAVGAGTCTITATSAGISATASLTVF